jgi:uncharacterized surface protein with fasciclin (FAS1) repeats
MPNKLTTSFAVLATGAALFVAGCGDDDNTASNSGASDTAAMTTPAADSMSSDKQPVEVGGEMMYPDKNVVENASNAPNLSTLVSAVKAAGLVETLSGEGPFTVFAPDNDAFDKLPKATLTDLLKPENKKQLTDILTYHVVPGTYAASDLTDGQELKTVNGETLKVSVKDGTVKVGDATVTQADVFQSNGVAHVIDTVLQP